MDIFEDGCVKSRNQIIKVIKIEPINYYLKSNLEKEAVLNSYKVFLKTCDFDIQILVQSRKENLSKHISNIQKSISGESNPKILEIAENYINYIQKKNFENRASSKNFYIIVKESLENNISDEVAIVNLNEKVFKIKESLSKVGNKVKPIQEKAEIKKILASFYNQRMFELF